MQNDGNVLRTDIEVYLSLRTGDVYAAKQSSTVGGGALTQTADEKEMRIVFHDPDEVKGPGTFVTFRLTGERELTVRRTSATQVEIVTTFADATEEKRSSFNLEIGQEKTFTCPYGRTARVRRIDHEDFELFPRG